MRVRLFWFKISLIILFILSAPIIDAQENISIKIEVESKESSLIKVTIKNNNPKMIIIYNMTDYLIQGRIYENRPNSYITFLGNPDDSFIESNPLVFNNSFNSFGKNIKKITPIKSKEALINNFLLYGNTPDPYIAFPNSEKYNIFSVQAKLVLTYSYEGDKKRYTKEFYSNTIEVLFSD